MLAAATPSALAKAGGNLDSSFGRRGKVLGRQDSLVDMAKLRNGDIVVAGESAMYAYLPNGKPDRRFGANGAVTPFAPAGRKVTIDGIAVDERGRIVLAGGAGHTATTANAGDATSYAAIERYLPGGDPDPSFGSNGAVITDFGLPLPARPTDIPDYAHVSLPVEVEASGVAIDSRGRIVVTGGRAATYEGTKSGTFAPVTEAFVARLNATGGPDPSFNRTGTQQLPGLSSVSKPALDRSDGLYFMASRAPTYQDPEPLATVGHLTAGGTVDEKFGQAGWRSLSRPFTAESSLTDTLDQKGRLLLFAGTSVERLEPNGSLDRAFGHEGVARIKSSAGEVTLGGLVTAGSAGILAVGTLRSQRKSAKGEPTYRLLLARLTGNGRLAKRFGSGGMVTTGFGRKSAPEGQAVLLDGGRVLVGGTASYGPRRPFRFVLSRYLLGR
jgi:uncharacterized delta-60 repeat protein